MKGLSFTKPQRELALAALLLCVAAGVFIWGAERLPFDNVALGYDWRLFWNAVHGGWPHYAGQDVYSPPWTLLLLVPFGWLSLQGSWGLLMLCTVTAALLSVPRLASGRLDVWRALALLFSYWTLRQLAEGNLAVFTIAGSLVLLNAWRTQSAWQMALGGVLITARYTESWGVLLGLAWLVVRTWPARRWLTVLSVAAVLIVPSLLLLGDEWLQHLQVAAQTDPVTMAGGPRLTRLAGNISLAALSGFSMPWPQLRYVLMLAVVGVTTFVTVKSELTLTPEKLGLWLSASMLLVPYNGGMSLASVLAIGVIPFWSRHRRMGFVLWLFANARYPFLWSTMPWPDVVQMSLIFVTWLALAWQVAAAEITLLRAGQS